MADFQDQCNLCNDAAKVGLTPQDPGPWAEHVQAIGYVERLNGDLLNKAIVDAIVEAAREAGE